MKTLAHSDGVLTGRGAHSPTIATCVSCSGCLGIRGKVNPQGATGQRENSLPKPHLFHTLIKVTSYRLSKRFQSGTQHQLEHSHASLFSTPHMPGVWIRKWEWDPKGWPSLSQATTNKDKLRLSSSQKSGFFSFLPFFFYDSIQTHPCRRPVALTVYRSRLSQSNLTSSSHTSFIHSHHKHLLKAHPKQVSQLKH